MWKTWIQKMKVAGQESLHFIEPCMLGSTNHENWSFEENIN